LKEMAEVSYCNRVQALELGNGYSALMMGTGGSSGSQSRQMMVPKARSFELPDDSVHYAPDRPADVRHVKLEIELDFEQETVSGTASTTFSALYEQVKTISFDAIALNIHLVTLSDGKQLKYHTSENQLIVTLDRPYQFGEEFTIGVRYDTHPRTGLHFIKPAAEDPTRPVQAWTFGQPRYHSHWFPCHDAPNDRATTEIIVTVPAQFLTVSNGNLLSVTNHGKTKTHHWRHDIPHAMYLLSLVVCDFAVIEDSYNGKPVTYYVRKDRKDDAPLYMGKTPAMMRFFSTYTGVEYPYDKYAQTVVEVYTGAMEHTTCTTHGFTLLLDEKASLDMGEEYRAVVAHELAHQWFGDLVTCRDWPNGWLNEGFATYFEELWNEHDLGNDYFKQSMLTLKKGYLSEDREYRRPIVYHVYHDHGFELFDRHMYNKGGWVLHMLRHQLGEATFKRAVKTYLERYREKEVITADLERTLEEVTGRSLGRFFQQWVYSGGYPAFEVTYAWDSEHDLVKIKIKQTQKVDELTPCFVTPVDLAFTIPVSDEEEREGGVTRTIPLRVVVGEDGQVEQSFYLPLEREPVMVRFDPDGWLLKTLKFERSAKMLRYQLAHDTDVLGRIEAADALGDKGEDEGLEALSIALNNDAFWGVRAASASALSTFGSGKAQSVLIKALQELDEMQFPRVRLVIAGALGKFQAPQQTELAQRSTQALKLLLERGDASYRVEANAAEALGRVRCEGNVDFLLTLLAERRTWMNVVERGICSGLGESGEDRIVDIMASYLNNTSNSLLLRRSAVAGLFAVGHNRYLYSEGARQKAVQALTDAVEHDTWEPTRSLAAVALVSLGEKRAIAVLEQSAYHELGSGAQRSMRVAAYKLSTSEKNDEQIKLLRNDLEDVREENRKLKEQLGSLEARLN
jgi:aminopeptidase N